MSCAIFHQTLVSVSREGELLEITLPGLDHHQARRRSTARSARSAKKLTDDAAHVELDGAIAGQCQQVQHDPARGVVRQCELGGGAHGSALNRCGFMVCVLR